MTAIAVSPPEMTGHAMSRNYYRQIVEVVFISAILVDVHCKVPTTASAPEGHRT